MINQQLGQVVSLAVLEDDRDIVKIAEEPREVFNRILRTLIAVAKSPEDSAIKLLLEAFEREKINEMEDWRRFCKQNIDRLEQLRVRLTTSFPIESENNTDFAKAIRNFFAAMDLFLNDKVDFELVFRTIKELHTVEVGVLYISGPRLSVEDYVVLDQTWMLIQELSQKPVDDSKKAQQNRVEFKTSEVTAIATLSTIVEVLHAEGFDIPIVESQEFINEVESIIEWMEGYKIRTQNQRPDSEVKPKPTSRNFEDSLFELKKIRNLVRNGVAAEQILSELGDIVLILTGKFDPYAKYKTPEMVRLINEKWEKEQERSNIPPLKYPNMATIVARSGIGDIMYVSIAPAHRIKMIPLLNLLNQRLSTADFQAVNKSFPNGLDYSINNNGDNMYRALIAYVTENFKYLIPTAPAYIPSIIRNGSIDVEFFTYLFFNNLYLNEILSFMEKYLIENAGWKSDSNNLSVLKKFLIDIALTIKGKLSKSLTLTEA